MAMTRKEFLKSASAATLALLLPDSSQAGRSIRPARRPSTPAISQPPMKCGNGSSNSPRGARRSPAAQTTFHRAGIPCISYIPTPQYLFATPQKGGVIAKLDKQRFYGEVLTFARCVAALDKVSVADIKG